MSSLLYPFYTIAHLALLVWAGILWSRSGRTNILVIAAVTFGLFYDNLILSLGVFLPAGDLLYKLSLPRFLLHQLVLPWMIYAAFLLANQAGHAWTAGKFAGWAAALSSLVVAVLGVMTRIVPMHMEPVVMDEITRYVAAGVSGPPLVSILSIGFTAVVGFMFWRKNGWPWIFLASILVFVGEGIPVEAVRRIAGSGGEVLFIFTMLKTGQWLERGSK